MGQHVTVDLRGSTNYKTMNVLFRVDASVQIGTGHVMRCLTLANALRREGHQCCFVMRMLHGSMQSIVEQNGFNVRTIPEYSDGIFTGFGLESKSHFEITDWHYDAELTHSSTASNYWDWIVVDNYGLDSRWESVVKPFCNSLLCIDDLANRTHCCDILIDPTLDRDAKDYSGLVLANDSIVECGIRYAFIRDEFHAYRGTSYERRERAEFTNIMISLGGSDPDNVTTDILKSFITNGNLERWQLSVVVGNSSNMYSDIVKMSDCIGGNCRVFRNVTNMAEHMSKADLAIGAGGGTTWERCYMGLPSLVLNIASNQTHIVNSIVHHGAAMEIDKRFIHESLTSILALLTRQPEILREMSYQARQLVDGKGISRIVSLMESGNFI